jgi:hypothetical protein
MKYIIRMRRWGRMRWAGYVARIEKKRKAYKILVRKSEWKTPIGIGKRII